ncbi:DUF177 domain-containing protein [Falsiroseomonas sp.]|uniref:YceD family protein n=1 Tax=Falsiroseomonas sp. TaxID=2870721 RepID=UPI0034A35614
MDSKPEFSRPTRLGLDPREVALDATAPECTALAERFGILGIGSLSARIKLEPETGGSIRARGLLVAEVEQACIVTLDPVRQQVRARIDLRLLGEGDTPGDDDPDSPDEIETSGGFVDLGEAVAEQLALALDPYPRAEGAELPAFDPPEEPEPEQPAKPNPFAALGKLRGG